MAQESNTQASERPHQSATRPEAKSEGNAPDDVRSRSLNTAKDQASEVAGEAAQINAELVGRNWETTQQALAIGMESTARAFERIAETMHQTFTGDGDGSKEIAQNLQAASQAGVGLAISAQKAYQACIDLTQQGVRSNLEAIGEMTRCRTIQDFTSVQTRLIRQNLEMAIQAGRAIASTSQHSLENAAAAIERLSMGH